MKRSSAGTYPSYKQAVKRQKTFSQQRADTQAARRIKRLIGVESKYYDVPVGFNAPASSDWSATEALAADEPQIAAGDDIYQRNGRKVLLSRVQFRGNVTFTPVVGDTAVRGAASGRIVLVRNLNPNGVSTSTQGEDVMGTAAGGAFSNVPTAIAGFAKTTGFGRFKIVDDQQLNFSVTASVNNNAGTTVSSAWEEKAITLSYRPKKPIEVQFGAVSGTPNTNSFNILFNMDSVQGTPSLQGIIRFYFTDA